MIISSYVVIIALSVDHRARASRAASRHAREGAEHMPRAIA